MTVLSSLVINHVKNRYKTEPFIRRDLDGNVVDTREYVTASEALNCLRSLMYDKQVGKEVSEEPDDEPADGRSNMPAEGYFERGHVMEDWFVSQLLDAAKKSVLSVHFVGANQATFTDDVYQIAGTPDGVIIDHDNKKVIVQEIKSTSSTVPAAVPKHVMQLSINAHLVARHFTKLGQFLDYDYAGQLIYINSSNWLSMRSFTYDSHNMTIRADTRMFAISDMFSDPPQLVPYEGVKTNACESCKHSGQCWSDMRKDAEAEHDLAKQALAVVEGAKQRRNAMVPFRDFSEPETLKTGEQAVAKYVSLKAQSKQLSDLADTYKEDAIAFIDYKDGKYETVDGYKTTVSVAKGRASLDKAKLSEVVNLDDYTTYGEESIGLRVTAPKQEK